MSVFFNGQQIVTPTTASQVNTDAMQDTNLSEGNALVIIGKSTGGTPKTLLPFTDPTKAAAVLRGGELCSAVVAACAPSEDTNSPGTIYALRVNPATQATLALNDSLAAPVINLASVNYGILDNQDMVKIEAGTTVGKMLTWFDGSTYLHADNVGKSVLSVQYTGASATATIALTATTLTLTVLAVPTAIDLNVFANVGDLVNKINSIAGFTASVLNNSSNDATLNSLDFITTAVDVKTAAVTVNAHLTAIVNWFNTVAGSVITAKRVAGAGTLPANIGYTFLSGGSDGVVSNMDWSTALGVLQGADVQWIGACTSDAAVHAMIDTHCLFCSNTMRKERRYIAGTALGTTDAAAITEAKSLNSKRTSLVHIGHYQYGLTGALELRPPYMTAILVAAGFAGMNPGNAMSNKSLKVQGLERNLNNPTDTDPLLLGGVMPIENTPKGYKVTQSITTWLGDQKYSSREQSCGAALDYTVRTTRDALDVLRGGKQNPILLSRAVAITQTALTELAKPEPLGVGVLAGDDTNPAFRNITATISGDVLAVQYECSPVIPNNYILVTVFAKPYSGTASI